MHFLKRPSLYVSHVTRKFLVKWDLNIYTFKCFKGLIVYKTEISLYVHSQHFPWSLICMHAAYILENSAYFLEYSAYVLKHSDVNCPHTQTCVIVAKKGKLIMMVVVFLEIMYKICILWTEYLIRDCLQRNFFHVV